jgi:hydrogenase maturation protein HypF
MRRSRGYAPNYITKKGDQYEDCVLSMGGLLKSTFGLSANGNLFISQYLGDTDTYRTQENYELVLKHFFHLFDVRPKAIVCDKHPNYFSSLEAQRLADDWGLPLHKFQHHIAHFYAIMGEYDLQKQQEAVMGVIWDGTGLGDDGHIWGGEFFNFHAKQVERIEHIPYFQHIAGDKMAREPRISALAILYSYGFSTESLQARFSEEEWDIYATMLARGSKIMCSSMGRLFDAIASIVLDIDFQAYEGEAAMQLEQAAHSYFIEHLPHRNMSYFRELDSEECTIQALIKGILSDHEKDVDPAFISARFHVSLIDYLDLVASQHHATCLTFSGGVFQNAWLVDIIHLFLSKKYSLYFHKEFSPNDENIAFGQLIYYFENQGL